MNMPSHQTHSEINDYRPTVLEQFVGQEGVVARIKVALEASWNDGTRLPDMLFVGGSGLGKTQLAEIVAKEMGSELQQQLAQNLNLPSALHGFLIFLLIKAAPSFFGSKVFFLQELLLIAAKLFSGFK